MCDMFRFMRFVGGASSLHYFSEEKVHSEYRLDIFETTFFCFLRIGCSSNDFIEFEIDKSVAIKINMLR